MIEFDEIKFDGLRHKYWYGDTELQSVTRWLSQFKPRFDADYWASRKAKERGVDKEAVLAEWELARRAGLERGTLVHDAIQATLDPESDKENLAEMIPEFGAFQKFWADAGRLIRPVGIEQIVGHPGWGIAGTVDLIYTDGQNVGLIDWKTGRKFRAKNDYENLLDPFEDLPNCELSSYSLQISLYRLMIEEEIGREMDEAYLIHLNPDGEYDIHDAVDLRDRLWSILAGAGEEPPF